MTAKQRAEIAKHAKRMHAALEVVRQELGSFAACDTPEKRDEWFNIIAAQSNVRQWFDPEYLRELCKP